MLISLRLLSKSIKLKNSILLEQYFYFSRLNNCYFFALFNNILDYIFAFIERMRALGLDLGTKSLGIAITDNKKTIVNGLENYFYSNCDLNLCIAKIKEIFHLYNYEIDTIVLGYPLYKSGDKSSQTIFVERFYDQLKENFKSVKIFLEDEKYSTVFAINSLKEIGLKSSKIKKIKDKISAIFILKS